ncbi:hypothetical protein [Vibrio quintilis]|uniref:Uncharacterized protein n=1 Tax=Vibrio quintilis TaxID=1117707 RepID=A0A1M7YZJ9_9VIBR|nr:hypothetical protein [Vibrio quintilis]SHO57866.1 hypothetical protein VQ7734_03636 [Vibrio quintilis]
MLRSLDETERRQVIKMAFEIIVDGVTAHCHSDDQKCTAQAGAYIAGLLLANTGGLYSYSAETYDLAASIMAMASESSQHR